MTNSSIRGSRSSWCVRACACHRSRYRLGPDLGLLADASALAAGEDHGLHGNLRAPEAGPSPTRTPRTSSTARRGTRLRSATHARELKRRAPVTRLAGSECRELECPPGLRSRPLPHCRADGAAPRPGPVAACRGELNRRAAAASLDPLVRRSLARNQPHDFESVRADRHRLKSEPGLNPTKRIALQRAQALTRADRQESAQHAQGW